MLDTARKELFGITGTRPGRLGFTRVLAWASRRHLLFPVGLFLFLRIWLSFWAFVSVRFIPPGIDSRTSYPGMPSLAGNLLDRILWLPWQRWDSLAYAKIAEQGYSSQDLSTAFYPLYPLLIRLTAPFVASNSIAAGMLISSAAALSSFILLYRFVRREHGEAAARRTLVCLAAFPSAFFLFAAYTESLFLLFVLGAYLCARACRWGPAGVLGALAGLTRLQGMFLLIPLAVEFFLQYRRKQVSFTQVLYLLVAVAGSLAFWLYLAIVFQNPFAWLSVQSHWRQTVMPWQPVMDAVAVIIYWRDGIASLYNLPDLVITILFLALIVRGMFRLSPTLIAYLVILVILPLFNLPRFVQYLPLASIGRYVLPAFPAFILLGQAAGRSILRPYLLAFSLLLQTFGVILFASWIFAG